MGCSSILNNFFITYCLFKPEETIFSTIVPWNDGDLDMANVSSTENHLNWFENITYESSRIDDFGKNDLRIYLNPATSIINFKTTISEDVSLSVYDL